MAHRDQIAWTDEDVRFAVYDLLVDDLRGMGNHEYGVAVGFQLRPLVRVLRILDGQIVQAEFFLQLLQDRIGRLVQAHPDETAVRPEPTRR